MTDDYTPMQLPVGVSPDLQMSLEYWVPLSPQALYDTIFTPAFEKHYFKGDNLGHVHQLRCIQQDNTGSLCLNEVHITNGDLIDGLLTVVNWCMNDDLLNYTTEVWRIHDSKTIRAVSKAANGTFLLSTKVTVVDSAKSENASCVSVNNQAWLDWGWWNVLKGALLPSLRGFIDKKAAEKFRRMLAYAKAYHDTAERSSLNADEMAVTALQHEEFQRALSNTLRIEDAEDNCHYGFSNAGTTATDDSQHAASTIRLNHVSNKQL